jgi:hypothetical protein
MTFRMSARRLPISARIKTGILAAVLLCLSAIVAPDVSAAEPISISITDAVVIEGEDAVITVHTSRPLPQAIKLVFTAVDGTATAGADYQGWKHKGRMKRGEQSKSWRVKTIDDHDTEAAEWFYVVVKYRRGKGMPIGLRKGYTIGDGLSEITIIDDDLKVRARRSTGTSQNLRAFATQFWAKDTNRYEPRIGILWNDVHSRGYRFRRNGVWSPPTKYSGQHMYDGTPLWDMDVEWGQTYRYELFRAGVSNDTPGTPLATYTVTAHPCTGRSDCNYEYEGVRWGGSAR